MVKLTGQVAEQADLGPEPVTVRICPDLINEAIAAAGGPPGDLLT
jgi:hypothetical protein